MTRAVLYARVSSDDSRKDGRNLAGQLDMGREYAERLGYAVVQELAEDDRGASGAAFELPQLNLVREMARNRQFDVLIVREIDRLSRNLAKQLIVEEQLKRAGVRIEYVLAEYADNPEGELMKHVRASVAEYERLKIVERNARGKALKVKAGSVMLNGQRPYGYRKVADDGKWALEIVPEEARIVRLIFDWYANGDGSGQRLSMHAIADRLTGMGVPTVNGIQNGKHGTLWARRTINNMLTNETYAGVWHYRGGDGGPLTVTVPAIVERALWERVQERKDDNRHTLRQRGKHDYLLSGMLTCGECKRGMSGSAKDDRKGGKRLYYRCNAADSYLKLAQPCRNRHYFPAELVEGKLWEWIKSLLLDDAALEQGIAEYQTSHERTAEPLRAELQTVDDLLKDKEAELVRATDEYLSKGGSKLKRILAQRAAQLEAEIATLEQRRGKLAVKLEARDVTAEQVQSLRAFRAKLAVGAELTDEDPVRLRRLFDALAVRGTLAVEDGEKVLYAECLFWDKRIPLSDTNTSTANRARTA